MSEFPNIYRNHEENQGEELVMKYKRILSMLCNIIQDANAMDFDKHCCNVED